MIGDIYKLKVACLSNKPQTEGVVFDNYQTGEQLIFPNGKYDGFSNEEKEKFLEFVRHEKSVENYVFKNVIQVFNDFEKGFWKECFKWMLY